MEGRALRKLTLFLVLSKEVRSLSHESTVCVSGAVLYTKQRRTSLRKRNGSMGWSAPHYFFIFFILPDYLLAIFPHKSTDSLLLCHVYAVALFSL